MTQQANSAELDNRFRYHSPRGAARKTQHERVRSACRALAEEFDQELPNGREKAIVMTKIEEAMFWANAALARSPE